MMKLIPVISKKAAKNLAAASLFSPVDGHSLVYRRFDLGKYRPETKKRVGSTIALDAIEYNWCHAIIYETRRDYDGLYLALYCLSTN